jgi:hypothetical protein
VIRDPGPAGLTAADGQVERAPTAANDHIAAAEQLIPSGINHR